MREIKFRGRTTQDRKWIYGSVFVDPDAVFITNCGCGFKVDPETVGEFTGLKDKEGTEIYEGDITEEKNFRTRRIVVWHLHGWFIKELDDEYYTPLTDGEYEIVVGNVYQNPELLERKT